MAPTAVTGGAGVGPRRLTAAEVNAVKCLERGRVAGEISVCSGTRGLELWPWRFLG